MQVITTHQNADFDSLAAMVAAKKIYPQAQMVFLGSQNKNLRDFTHLHQDFLDFLNPKEVDKKQVKRLIIVDTRVGRRLGELEDLIYQKGTEVFTFDHHPESSEDLKMTRDFSKNLGATTTLLASILRQKKVEISPFEATLFALGIHEDTGSLTYPTTTAADGKALTYLIKKGANFKIIREFLNRPLNLEQEKLMEVLLKSAHFRETRGIKVMFTQAEVLSYLDGASVLVHKIRDLKNAEVVIVLLKMEDKVRIIARSGIKEVDVGEILSQFGGGGHPQAASAKIPAISFKELEEKLCKEIMLRARPPLEAQDVMEKVEGIGLKTKVFDAGRIMRNSGEKILPVLEKRRIVGFITEKEVKKAASHSLSHAPVKGFILPRVKEVFFNTPLYEVERFLVEERLEKIPVIRNKKTVGIITRRRLLKTFYDQSGRRVFQNNKIKGLPESVLGLLREIGKLGKKEGFKVYLVGGIVRDLLLEVPNLDLDLVVEGKIGVADKPAITLGEKLVKKLGGEITTHPKFGTAVLFLPSGAAQKDSAPAGLRLDLASARKEYYQKPAVLPEVKPAPLKVDLSRRDFTINSMAFTLAPDNFGEILDFFGGLKDLRQKKLRILHQKSFLEDPTRIFRAVRLEKRLGFKMDEASEKLAKEALEKVAMRLSGPRLRPELISILKGEAPFEIFKRLQNLGSPTAGRGGLKFLHPKLKLTPSLKTLFGEVKKAYFELNWYFSREPKIWLVLLMALFRNLGPREAEILGKRLKLKREEILTFKESLSYERRILRLLAKEECSRSKIYFTLRDFPEECLLYFYAKAPSLVKKRIALYLKTLKGIKPSLTGKDLTTLGLKPSPKVGALLKKLEIARLEGKVKSREDELALVQREI